MSYTYDHSGSRVKSTNATTGEETVYINQYMELRDGEPVYYIFAGGTRVASLEDDNSGTGTLEITYLHQDHLGGTALATDSDGLVVQLYDYYPFGTQLSDLGYGDSEVEVSHSFTDKEFEEELGLYYFEARWYDSEIGKFGSMDPAVLEYDILNTNEEDPCSDEWRAQFDPEWQNSRKSDPESDSAGNYVENSISNEERKCGSPANLDLVTILLDNSDEKDEKDELRATIEEYLKNPQMANAYSYAANNPILLIDPSGEMSVDTRNAIILTIGAFGTILAGPISELGAYMIIFTIAALGASSAAGDSDTETEDK